MGEVGGTIVAREVVSGWVWSDRDGLWVYLGDEAAA